MRAQTLGGFLDDLASDAPAPGGGAAVGVSVALAAALVAMVCRLTLGRKGFDAATIEAALAQADALRHRGLVLAEQDALAFAEVSAAYKFPRATDSEAAARREAIQSRLLGAATVPLDAAGAARDVAALAGSLVGRSNPRVVSDLGVAAASARAAVAGASLNVHVNTGLLDDREVAADLDRRIDALVAETVAVADRVMAQVEAMVAS